MGTVGACIMLGTSIGSLLGGVIGRHAPQMVFAGAALISLLIGVFVIFGVRDSDNRKSDTIAISARRLLRRHRALFVPYVYAFIDRFCVGVIISTFMLYLSNVLSFAPHERGMMMAYFMLPFAALCYPVGRLIDRIGRIWPMAIGSLMFGLLLATYGFLTPQWLPVVMVVSGIMSAIMFAPNLALCADIAPPEQRATAFAGFNMAGSLGFLCGPLLAGALCAMLLPALGEQSGYRVVLALAGAGEVICAVITLPMLLKLKKSGRIR